MSTKLSLSSSQPSYTCNCSYSALCTHNARNISSGAKSTARAVDNANREDLWSFLPSPILIGDIVGTVTTIGAAAIFGIPGAFAAGSGYVVGKLVQLQQEDQLRQEDQRQKIERRKQLAFVNFSHNPEKCLKIQAVWRGHLVRVKETNRGRKQLLSYSLFKRARSYVDTPSLLRDLPRASAGKTRVYLPERLPIVLKLIGSPKNQKRFEQMREARKICVGNSYTHLVIPMARVYGNFIIESRLPIAEHNSKAQIGLYIEHREQFTEAVKEFTGFLYKSKLSDITGDTNDRYSTLFESNIMGRYDNVPLYLEKGKGKIGLIDLENFSTGFSCSGCRDAVRLFPLHFTEILCVAKKFDPDVENNRKNLEKERDIALRGFKSIYLEHLAYIRKKGIGLSDPLEKIKINSARRENIKTAVVSFLRKESIGENKKMIIAGFENSFPKILDLITTFIYERTKANIDKAEKAISSYEQLVSCRTLIFDSFRPLQLKVVSELGLGLERNDFFLDEPKIIVRSIFKELAKGKELAYYNPHFGNGGWAAECIFY